MSIFEKASKQKLRFATTSGVLATEDLWDLGLPKLDAIYKSLNKRLKDSEEDSLLGSKSKEDTETALQVDIIKYIVTVKLDEKNKTELRAQRKAERERLLAALANKEDEAINNMSPDELKAKLASLDDEA